MAEKYVSVSELRKLLGIPTDGDCVGCKFATFHGCKDGPLLRVCEAIDDAPEAVVVEKTEWDKLMFLVDAANQILEAAKWISVKERLPERPDNWPHCAIRRCYFLVALESGCVESLGFDFREMRWHSTGSPVTHWMPLPEPPKEGG